MAKGIYRVFYTEYERGWGQRPDGYSVFETRAEAEEHKKKYNSQNNLKVVPDWYTVADRIEFVEVEDV